MNFLTRWDPFDELTILRNRMDRLLNKINDEETPALTAATAWAPTSGKPSEAGGSMSSAETPISRASRCESWSIHSKKRG